MQTETEICREANPFPLCPTQVPRKFWELCEEGVQLYFPERQKKSFFYVPVCIIEKSSKEKPSFLKSRYK